MFERMFCKMGVYLVRRKRPRGERVVTANGEEGNARRSEGAQEACGVGVKGTG